MTFSVSLKHVFKHVLKRIFALCFLFFLVLSPDAFSQDFSSLDQDLALLENLIQDTIANTQEQQKLLQDLHGDSHHYYINSRRGVEPSVRKTQRSRSCRLLSCIIHKKSLNNM